MAKLYFYYSSMNAGKSTNLLQSSFNYRERGMDTMLFTSIHDDRFEVGVIRSRIGLESKAHVFDDTSDLFAQVTAERARRPVDCVLIDEAQFLTRDQVYQLARVCDRLSIPVLAYGIRTDFRASLFEGSMHLLALADELRELKAICECGRKATMNLRIDAEGRPVREGEQREIGGNDRYVALCRKHFMEHVFPEG